MKFTIVTIFAFAALAIAAPNVDVIEKRQTDTATAIQAAQAAKCEAKSEKSELNCCGSIQSAKPSQIAATGGGGLLDLLTGLLGGASIPVALNCVSVIPLVGGIPINICKQQTFCCNAAPVKPQSQNINGGLQLINLNGDVIPINNLCLGSVV